jgi:hypothetical protein
MVHCLRRSNRANLPVAIAPVLLLSAPLSAGTVTFDPPALTVHQGETASIVVGINDTDLSEFNALDVFVSVTGNADWLTSRIAFDYVLGLWQQPEPSPVYPLPAVCVADRCGFRVGGYRSSPFYTSPHTIGTFILDTTAMPPGTYELITSTAWESQVGEPNSGLNFLGGPIEPLEGAATLTIVPEPASLLLLTLAAVAAVMPRRAIGM